MYGVNLNDELVGASGRRTSIVFFRDEFGIFKQGLHFSKNEKSRRVYARIYFGWQRRLQSVGRTQILTIDRQHSESMSNLFFVFDCTVAVSWGFKRF